MDKVVDALGRCAGAFAQQLDRERARRVRASEQQASRTRRAVNEHISPEISHIPKEIRMPYALSMLHNIDIDPNSRRGL
jgi:hypothetical protein